MKRVGFWWCSPRSSVFSVIQPYSFTSAGKWRDGAVSQEKTLSIALFCDQTNPIWEPFPIPKGWDLPYCRLALAGVGSLERGGCSGIRSLCGCAGPSAASETQPGIGARVKDDFAATVVLLVLECILDEF